MANRHGKGKIPADIRRLARTHTVEALNALVRIVRSQTAPEGAIATACQAILDRGWGRPGQAIEMTVEDKRVGDDVTAWLRGAFAKPADPAQPEPTEPTEPTKH